MVYPELKDSGGESVEGVLVVGFRSNSCVREAGMEKGDVIVEYDGVRNLTTKVLTDLIATKVQADRLPGLAFVRDGKEHSIVVPQGPLGIHVQDTPGRSSFAQREPGDEIWTVTLVFLWIGILCIGLIFLLVGSILFIPYSWSNAVFLVLFILWVVLRVTNLGFAISFSWQYGAIGGWLGAMIGTAIGYGISNYLEEPDTWNWVHTFILGCVGIVVGDLLGHRIRQGRDEPQSSGQFPDFRKKNSGPEKKA